MTACMNVLDGSASAPAAGVNQLDVQGQMEKAQMALEDAQKQLQEAQKQLEAAIRKQDAAQEKLEKADPDARSYSQLQQFYDDATEAVNYSRGQVQRCDDRVKHWESEISKLNSTGVYLTTNTSHTPLLHKTFHCLCLHF